HQRLAYPRMIGIVEEENDGVPTVRFNTRQRLLYAPRQHRRLFGLVAVAQQRAVGQHTSDVVVACEVEGAEEIGAPHWRLSAYPIQDGVRIFAKSGIEL